LPEREEGRREEKNIWERKEGMASPHRGLHTDPVDGLARREERGEGRG